MKYKPKLANNHLEKFLWNRSKFFNEKGAIQSPDVAIFKGNVTRQYEGSPIEQTINEGTVFVHAGDTIRIYDSYLCGPLELKEVIFVTQEMIEDD